MAIVSIGYDGPITEPGMAGLMPRSGSADYGVDGAGDWKVTAHPTTPGGLNIAPGRGWGPGVIDTTDAIETVVQSALPSSGTRWDLVVRHRDWTPPGGASSAAIIQGTSTKQLPARDNNPGTKDDQPLALVQWTAGQTQPTVIVDLRIWAANGGLVAKDPLVQTFLTRIGSEVAIGSTVWQYRLGDNDVPTWYQSGQIERVSASTTDSTWNYNVTLTRFTDPNGVKTVTCGFLVARNGGGGFMVSQGAWLVILAALIPAGWRPNDDITTVGCYEFMAPSNGMGGVLLKFRTSGNVEAAGLTGSVNMAAPTKLSGTAHWTCA
jgi:hypothetical protein